MSKRKGEDSNILKKKEKKIEMSSTDFLKTKIIIGDKST